MTKRKAPEKLKKNAKDFAGKFYKDDAKGQIWSVIEQTPDGRKVRLLTEKGVKVWVTESSLEKKFTEHVPTRITPTGEVKIREPFGRPMKIDTVEELEAALASYFEKCEERMVSKHDMFGKEFKVNIPEPESIIGICVHLGISHNRLNKLQERPDFHQSITVAKARCEQYAVRACYEGKPGNKADFILKNNFRENWQERVLVESPAAIDVPERESREEWMKRNGG